MQSKLKLYRKVQAVSQCMFCTQISTVSVYIFFFVLKKKTIVKTVLFLCSIMLFCIVSKKKAKKNPNQVLYKLRIIYTVFSNKFVQMKFTSHSSLDFLFDQIQ